MAMGRTSIRTPAKSGFHQTVSGEVFGQGISEGRPLAHPGCWLGRKPAAQTGGAAQGGAAAGVRSDCRVAARPLGTLAPRSRLYPAGTGLTERSAQ